MRAGPVVYGWTRQGVQRDDSCSLPLSCISPRLLQQEQAGEWLVYLHCFPSSETGKKTNKQIIHRCSITHLTVIFLFYWSFKHKRLWAQKDAVSGCCSAGLEEPGWMNHMHVSLGEGGVWFQFWAWFFAGFPHSQQIAPSEAASGNKEDCSPVQESPLNYNHSFLTNSNLSINKSLAKPHGWGDSRDMRMEKWEEDGRNDLQRLVEVAGSVCTGVVYRGG